MKALSRPSANSFKTLTTLKLGGRPSSLYSLRLLAKQGFAVERLPYSLRLLLENLLRHEGEAVAREDIEALASGSGAGREIAFRPARVLMQDFTGVPAVVDLAAMREAFRRLGGDPARINPGIPVDLVVDHSVQVDSFGSAAAFAANASIEMRRNRERYLFLKWGQAAFERLRVVPPDMGICHQVNLEYLASVVFERREGRDALSYPDTLVGTDSHTTMVNGLGVLGWGVGGIEAEAAMLGEPTSMLVPEVVGVRVSGKLREGSTATDAVLTLTQLLRKIGVVGKFVEFFGPGLKTLSVADRATLSNMCPEYGATAAYFPVDARTLEYLKQTGREAGRISFIRDYLAAQGLFHSERSPEPEFSSRVELDLSCVESSLAGPKRPQDLIPLGQAKSFWERDLASFLKEKDRHGRLPAPAGTQVSLGSAADAARIGHGAVVIAAITSCTNTSNPFVMLAAGLLAKKALAAGLKPKPWVKTSLAPGSRTVMSYLAAAGLKGPLEKLGFNLVGFGCTTCIGNSGPLPEPVAQAVADNNLIAAAVLSGNRNFEGRINPLVRANYLATPPLVVAYALTGRMDVDLLREPLGQGKKGPVFLKDIWPPSREIEALARRCVRRKDFLKDYKNVFGGVKDWKALKAAKTPLYQWEKDSTYVRLPPFFETMGKAPEPPRDIRSARALALFGDSITTDHISPAGSIAKDGPAGLYLSEHGVVPADFNSYGSRRGNHEAMMRGTFANIRIKNLLVDSSGGWTLLLPEKEKIPLYDAAMRYKERGVPLIVLAGKEYGSGSSRDWAAKGPALLGVRAVVAQSFERIHRSNLIGMGILPLEFKNGESARSLGLSGLESFDIADLADLSPRREIVVRATAEDGSGKEFRTVARIDTSSELEYWRHGGILQHVLRRMLRERQ